MIQEIERIRPHFRTNDLLLGERTGELSYIPDEFVPHTVTVSQGEAGKVEFNFEYPINELPGRKEFITDGVEGVFGKYSNKVLILAFTCLSILELIHQIQVASEGLGAKESSLRKDSYKRNFELVREILSKTAGNLQRREDEGKSDEKVSKDLATVTT